VQTPDEPRYQITVVAEMLAIHPNLIRRYEREGLVRSYQSAGQKLYSERALTRLRRIVSVTSLGVNLPGADVVCNLLERLDQLKQEREVLEEQLHRFLHDD
jgi:MerR family transcriptional regulator/heat shock protein HspR